MIYTTKTIYERLDFIGSEREAARRKGNLDRANYLDGEYNAVAALLPTILDLERHLEAAELQVARSAAKAEQVTA